MPPRIRGSSCPPQLPLLLHSLECAPMCSLPPPAVLVLASASRRAAQSPPAAQAQGLSRAFSTTSAHQKSRVRERFREWLEGYGAMLRHPKGGGSTNYLSSVQKTAAGAEVAPDQPFPTNPTFRSQPVLSESAREAVWAAVMRHGMPIKAVSARFNVDVRRVAAVVRMKEIEKKWEAERKPLATRYSRAVLDMVPTADLGAGERAFEPVNDLHVHSFTMQQLFWPAAESKAFTRADAARAFGERVLPPDARVRVPELVDMHRDIAGGTPFPEAFDRLVEATRRSERDLAARNQAELQAAEARRVRVHDAGGRFEYRFERINAEAVGRKGRSRTAVGWKYGAPHRDRMRGEVKIPTSVG